MALVYREIYYSLHKNVRDCKLGDIVRLTIGCSSPWINYADKFYVGGKSECSSSLAETYLHQQVEGFLLTMFSLGAY